MDIQPRSDPVARARELGLQIAAAADEIERTQRTPEELLERLHDSRLFRMLPARWWWAPLAICCSRDWSP